MNNKQTKADDNDSINSVKGLKFEFCSELNAANEQPTRDLTGLNII